MLTYIKKFLFVHKLTFNGYSLLRIAQINEVKRLEINGSILDLGSKKSVTNVTNYLNTKNKIIYGDNYSDDPKDLKIDLEKVGQLNGIRFDNILLLNVLEHIFNYKNCLRNCYSILNENGKFYSLFSKNIFKALYYDFKKEQLIRSEDDIMVLNDGGC